MQNVKVEAPVAKKVPVERVFHGDTYVDNYEWVRGRGEADVKKLLQAENEYALAMLESSAPLRDTIVEEIRSRIWEDDFTLPIRMGDWWYYTRTFKNGQYPAMYRIPAVSNTPPTAKDFANEALVWDGNLLAQGYEFFSCGGFLPSPNGKLGALCIDLSGNEHYSLRIFDIATGHILDDSVRNIGYGLCWTADSQSIAYTTVDEAWRPWQVRIHTIGSFNDDVVYEETDEKFSVSLSGSRNGKWMVCTSASVTSTEVTMISTEDTAKSFVVTPREEGVEYFVEPTGDQFLVVHNVNNKDFDISGAPMRSSTPDEWTTILSPGEGERIEDVDAYATHAVVSMRSGGATQLRVMKRYIDKDSFIHMWSKPVKIPQLEGSLVETYPNGYWESTRVIFTEESVLTPPTQRAYCLAEDEVIDLKTLDVPNYDPADYIEELVFVTSRDGVQIPLTLVRHKDVQADGTNPGYITGYGSYEISTEPNFSVYRLPYLDRGVVVAIAHVRGGGEYGREWYEQGKLLNKKNTFNDFVDCSQWLIDNKWVAPERLVAEGGSAGGLLIGAVINQAPHLYRAVHAAVPFVDNLTTMVKPELPLTVGEWEEWGNPILSEEVYEYMKSYAPIENIQATEYPAVLATTSLDDIRVLYVEPTKWVQVLRETVTNDPETRPILELIDMNAGHGGVSGRYNKWLDRARHIAWLLQQVNAG